MKKSWKHVGLAAGILGMAFIISFLLSQQKETMQKRPAGGGEQPLKLMTVQHQDVYPEIRMTGPLNAYHRIELYAEVSGVLQNTSPPFKTGVSMKKGDVILQIDDRVYRNTVQAQRSGLLNQITLLLPDLKIDFPARSSVWEDYLRNFDIQSDLRPLPEAANDQERYYIASRNIYQLYYSIKSMEEMLAKYTIHAPFNGVISSSEVNPGTLIRTGQKLGEFAGRDLYEMEAAVTLFEAGGLKPGQQVSLTSDDMRGTFEGTVQRVNSVVDRSTMTVKVYIHTRDDRLKDGMYLIGTTQSLPIQDVVALKRDLLINGHVYIVKDSVLALQPVSVVANAGEQVLVKGLTDGMQVLNEVWQEAGPGKHLPASSMPAQAVPGVKGGPRS